MGPDQKHDAAVRQVIDAFRISLAASGFEVSTPETSRLVGRNQALGRQVGLSAINGPACPFAEFSVTWTDARP